MQDCGVSPHLSVRLPRKQIAATVAVALMLCVALVSHDSVTSFKSKVLTHSSLTRVARWAETPDAENQNDQQTTMMLAADFPVFTMLAGDPGMNCSAPNTCARSASLTLDASVVRIRMAQVLEKDRLSRP
jgi:hypothetical protein